MTYIGFPDLKVDCGREDCPDPVIPVRTAPLTGLARLDHLAQALDRHNAAYHRETKESPMTTRAVTTTRLETFARMSAEMLATGHPCWSDAIDDLIVEQHRLVDELLRATSQAADSEAELTDALRKIVDLLEPAMGACECDANEHCELPVAAACAHRVAREVLGR